MAEKKLRQIRVKGTGKPDNKVILYERHKDHPLPFGDEHANDEVGEVFIVNDGRVYTVAETKEVKRLLGEDKLTTELNGNEVDVESTRSSFRQATGEELRSVPALRSATDQEEDAAKPPLTGKVEKDTAKVPVTGGIQKGGRPE